MSWPLLNQPGDPPASLTNVDKVRWIFLHVLQFCPWLVNKTKNPSYWTAPPMACMLQWILPPFWAWPTIRFFLLQVQTDALWLLWITVGQGNKYPLSLRRLLQLIIPSGMWQRSCSCWWSGQFIVKDWAERLSSFWEKAIVTTIIMVTNCENAMVLVVIPKTTYHLHLKFPPLIKNGSYNYFFLLILLRLYFTIIRIYIFIYNEVHGCFSLFKYSSFVFCPNAV